jgi:hypothetical protein
MTYLPPFIQTCISNVNIEEYFRGGMQTGTYTALALVLINKLLQNLNKTSLKYPSWCHIFYLVTSPEILFNVYIGNACLNERR